ncbi:hypothetical protein K505DRAFT_356247 [Melanomma pulvis-pyrius CBS 109.77]|uniref:Uncharacterized protein n=1 Tax=Melanomma pulvis-pyrius CBS 109.77 TaxID=1314802 RepID=A0A6A6XWC0_9PLEO|nr:hypothetical protein K505DRAFT_356247 [Melanomma pulvis-pyrius CBS 109.77]
MAQSLHTSSLVPMGFAARIRALEDAQKEQADKQKKQEDRFEVLEKEVATKDRKIEALETKLAALEQVNKERASRHTSAVAHFRALRFSHKEAREAFLQQITCLEKDEFERHMCAFATTVSTILNHEQCSHQGFVHNQPPVATYPEIAYPFYGQQPPAYHHYGGYQYQYQQPPPPPPPLPLPPQLQPQLQPQPQPQPQQQQQQPQHVPTKVVEPACCAPHNKPHPCQLCRGW